MKDLRVLGAYVITALILPGLIILTAGAVLFPELQTAVAPLGVAQQVALVLLASFLSGHVPYCAERLILTRLWNWLFPKYGLVRRGRVLATRRQTITRLEVRGLSHKQFDAALGSFILYYNTSFWCVVMSATSVFVAPLGMNTCVAILIGTVSLVALLVTAPLYKRNVLDVLEVLHEELERLDNQTSEHPLSPRL